MIFFPERINNEQKKINFRVFFSPFFLSTINVVVVAVVMVVLVMVVILINDIECMEIRMGSFVWMIELMNCNELFVKSFISTFINILILIGTILIDG